MAEPPGAVSSRRPMRGAAAQHNSLRSRLNSSGRTTSSTRPAAELSWGEASCRQAGSARHGGDRSFPRQPRRAAPRGDQAELDFRQPDRDRAVVGGDAIAARPAPAQNPPPRQSPLIAATVGIGSCGDAVEERLARATVLGDLLAVMLADFEQIGAGVERPRFGGREDDAGGRSCFSISIQRSGKIAKQLRASTC